MIVGINERDWDYKTLTLINYVKNVSLIESLVIYIKSGFSADDKAYL